jgi:LysM repeat protein
MTLNIPRFGGSSHEGHADMALVEPVKTGAPAARTAKAEKTARPPEKAVKAEPEKAPREEREREPASTYHVVQKGETLSGISTRYGVEMTSLIFLNNLKDKKVYPNMKLMLASHHSPKKKEVAGPVRIHTVKKGETLPQISSKYVVNVGRLKPASNRKSATVHPRVKLRMAAG